MSQDCKYTPQIQQLLQITRLIDKIQKQNTVCNIQARLGLIKQLNQLLIKLSNDKIYDIIDFLAKSVCKQDMQVKNQQQIKIFYFSLFSNFITNTIAILATIANHSPETFKILIDIFSLQKKIYIFQKMCISSLQDTDLQATKQFFNKLEWIQNNTQNKYLKNSIFYLSINYAMRQITIKQQLQSNTNFLVFIQRLNMLSLLSKFLKKKNLLQVMKIIFKGLKKIRLNDQKLKQYTKGITAANHRILKKYIEDIIKQIENDTKVIYSVQIIRLKECLQQSLNEFGSQLIGNQSIQKRLVGLRLIYNQTLQERQFLTWIKQKKVLQAILKETTHSAFVNSAQSIFKIILKYSRQNRQLINQILIFLQKCTFQIRKIVLKYVNSSSIFQNVSIYGELLQKLLASQKAESYTQQIFQFLSKILIRSTFENQKHILSRSLTIYLQIIDHSKSCFLPNRCRQVINQTVVKILQGRGEHSIKDRLRTITDSYQFLSKDPISHIRLKLMSTINNKIYQRGIVSFDVKQLISNFLIKDLQIIGKGLGWIRETTEQSLIQQIQLLIQSIINNTSQKSKLSLIQNKQIIIQASNNLKVFQLIFKLNKNNQYRRTNFQEFVKKSIETNTTQCFKCIRHYFFKLNDQKINAVRQNSLYVSCIGSELQEIQTITDALMMATHPKIRFQLAELIADLYTSYSESIKQRGQKFIQQIYKELSDNFVGKWYISLYQNSLTTILGYLALVLQLLSCSEMRGVGENKPHKSLVSFNQITIKIINQIDYNGFSQTNKNRTFERRLKANYIFFDLIQDACQQFNCDITKIQVRQRDKLISFKKAGLTLEQLQLDGKILKFTSSYRNQQLIIRKQKIIQNGKLTQKAQRAITEIFYNFAKQGKMGQRQCVDFVLGVTKSSIDVTDRRVPNFIQNYDDDKDGYITLANFLKFYNDKAIQKSDSDVWVNLTNMGYRHDLRKWHQPLQPLPDRLLLRSYLIQNQKIYQVLFQMLDYEHQQLRNTAKRILFHLPTSESIKNSRLSQYELKNENSIKTQYYLILIHHQLQSCKQRPQKKFTLQKEIIQKIFGVITNHNCYQNKQLPRNKCVLLALKILRHLCPIKNLQVIQDQWITLENNQKQSFQIFQLDQTDIFVQLMNSAFEYSLTEVIQSLFALQLYSNFKANDKNRRDLGLKQALRGVCNSCIQIRQISSNFIYYQSIYIETNLQLFQYEVTEHSHQWYLTLAKIIEKSKNINHLCIINNYMEKLANRSQTLQMPYDPIINGYLVVILTTVRKAKININFQKMVGILSRTISGKNRKLIYHVLSLVDFQHTILLIKQLLCNFQVYPQSQLSIKNKLVGLNNLGNTCYVNSILQLFFWIDQFRYEITSLNTDQKILMEQAQSQGQLLEQIKRLYQYLQHGYNKFYDTTNFCRVYKNRQLLSIDVKQQEDAHQFQIHFLQVMESYLLKAGRKNIFQQLFTGKVISQCICAQCENKSSRQQQFRCLTLQVKGQLNLKSSFDKFTQPEIIQDYACETCAKKVSKVTKFTSFSELPKYLTINLHRIFYDFQMRRYTKISSKFDFPDLIDLKQYITQDKMIEQNDYLYRLKAVVIHAGTGQSGHYYSIIRIGQGWYKFDDKNVSQYDIKNIQSQGYGTKQQLYQPFGIDSQTHSKNAYILCYQKLKIAQQEKQIKIPNKDSNKIRIDRQLYEEIKRQKNLILDQLKICNQSVFQFCIEIFEQIKPEGIQQKIKNEIYRQNWRQQRHLQMYSEIFDLSILLLRFLKKFWRLQDQTVIPRMGYQIYYLLFLLPQKTYKFIQQTPLEEPIQYLCIHPDNHVKSVYKHLLAKAIHQFLSYYQFNLQQDEQCVNHLLSLLNKMVQFLRDKMLYENIFQLEMFFQFWLIMIECIKSVEKYLNKMGFLLTCLQILSNDTNSLSQNSLNKTNFNQQFSNARSSWTVVNQSCKKVTQDKFVPCNIAKIICRIVQALAKNKYKIKNCEQGANRQNKSIHQYEIECKQQKQNEEKIAQRQLEILMKPSFYQNIIKNNFDIDKYMGTIIKQMCKNNQWFSKQIGLLLLKALKTYQDKSQILSTVLQYMNQYLSVDDQFMMKRTKWLFGIPQLQMGDECVYGFKKDQKSTLYKYVSTLYFSQFNKYPPLLQLLVNFNQWRDYRENNLNILNYVIHFILSNNMVLVYLKLLPSPVCIFANYFDWIQIFQQRLQQVHEKLLPIQKNLYLKNFKAYYADLKQRIKTEKYGDGIQPSNKFLIGRNKTVQERYVRLADEFQVILLEHQTYVLLNKPSNRKNSSIQQFFFSKPESKYFISISKEKPRNGAYSQSQQNSIRSQKTIYTFIVKSKKNLSITFRLPNFQQQIYVQNGKCFINFPYQLLEFDDISKCINIRVIEEQQRPIQRDKKVSQDVTIMINKQPIEIVQDNRQKKNCPKCTFLNHIDAIQCEICETQMV